MALLNYTTKVSVNRTIGEIHGILAGHGAHAVVNEYAGGEVIAVSFSIDTAAHGELSIRLPIDVAATLRVLQRQGANREVPRHFVRPEQAKRIAWRTIKDWLEAQMALLETEMMKMEQIFLPCVITRSGQTLFEVMENRKFLKEGEGE